VIQCAERQSWLVTKEALKAIIITMIIIIIWMCVRVGCRPCVDGDCEAAERHLRANHPVLVSGGKTCLCCPPATHTAAAVRDNRVNGPCWPCIDARCIV